MRQPHIREPQAPQNTRPDSHISGLFIALGRGCSNRLLAPVPRYSLEMIGSKIYSEVIHSRMMLVDVYGFIEQAGNRCPGMCGVARPAHFAKEETPGISGCVSTEATVDQDHRSAFAVRLSIALSRLRWLQGDGLLMVAHGR